MKRKKVDPSSLVAKGDEYMRKGKPKKALKKYMDAKVLSPDNADIYDRLIKAHEASTKEWDIEDFAKSVSWLMTKQEIEHPKIKMLHERMTPEWKDITDHIAKLITASEEDEESLISKICAYGEKAVMPLIEFILYLKNIKGEKERE